METVVTAEKEEKEEIHLLHGHILILYSAMQMMHGCQAAAMAETAAMVVTEIYLATVMLLVKKEKILILTAMHVIKIELRIMVALLLMESGVMMVVLLSFSANHMLTTLLSKQVAIRTLLVYTTIVTIVTRRLKHVILFRIITVLWKSGLFPPLIIL